MHTTLTTRSLAAAGALSAVLLLSGCSSTTTTGSGVASSSSAAASASASASASATPGGGTSGTPGGTTSATGATVVVHNADKGHTVTLHPGQTLQVVLTGGYWPAPTSSSAAVLKQSGAPTLASPSPGHGCPPGVGCRAQQTEFVAVAAGTATVSATRTNCGEAMRCTDANGKFDITVVVAAS
ncbi:hypothetical protein DN069_31880 [Streptacidiphilus pinicola]|uniref:REJ domain-containing protein n=1 Tax=Streptacidiphilus pinicola TaxID=2219663 RepID=A0A2X0JXA2_9ACTN|nr:hypothetical protein [Streptacidiphilus pinicola]RAG81625.1 hypothetical protein DN069_31880 [Streptacidiphilus pinicola]